MLKYWCIVGAKYKNQKKHKAAEIPSFLPSLAELDCMPLKVPEKLTSRTMPSKYVDGSLKRGNQIEGGRLFDAKMSGPTYESNPRVELLANDGKNARSFVYASRKSANTYFDVIMKKVKAFIDETNPTKAGAIAYRDTLVEEYAAES